MTEEKTPHYRDFFIYIFFLILAIIGAIFVFSRNTSDTISTSNITQSKPTQEVKIEKVIIPEK